MITFWTGLPGSGKTYRSVDYLHKCFIDDKSKEFKKYKFFCTNINEFNFDKFPPGVGSVFDYSLFYSYLQDLYLEAVVNKMVDSELLLIAEKNNLKDCIIIIDECHNYFDVDDKILVWWLSYHRHLHQEIFLITQNLDLVHKKYYSFSEFYYKAVPTSLRLFKSNFYYKLYTSPKLYQKTLVDTVKIKFNPDVFALYHSGQNHQTKNFVYKAIGIVLILLVVVFFVFSFLFSSLDSKSNTEEDLETKSNTITNSSVAAAAPSTVSNNNNIVLPKNNFIYFYCVRNECSGNNEIIELSFLTQNYQVLNVDFGTDFNTYKVLPK